MPDVGSKLTYLALGFILGWSTFGWFYLLVEWLHAKRRY